MHSQMATKCPKLEWKSLNCFTESWVGYVKKKQKVGDGLCVCVLPLPNLVAIKLVKVINLSNCHLTSHLVKWLKGHVAFREWASHSKLAPCLIWCTWVFCKWRYNVLNLSSDFTRPTYSVVIWICGWTPRGILSLWSVLWPQTLW